MRALAVALLLMVATVVHAALAVTLLNGPVVIGANDIQHVGSMMEINRVEQQSTYTAISWSAGHPLRAGGMFFIRSRGDEVGEWIETQDGDQLGEIEYFGTDTQNTISEIAAALRLFQVGDAGASRVKTRFVFQTGTATDDAKDRFSIDENVVVGDRQNLLATNATKGFFYLPAMAGRPTATPEAVTGSAPAMVNVSQNELCLYVGAAWRCLQL